MADTIEKILNLIDRDYRALALTTDFPKLIKQIDIIDGEKNQLFSAISRRSGGTSHTTKEILVILIKRIDDSSLGEVEAKCNEMFINGEKSVDDTGDLEEFFEDIGGEESRLIKFLKCCTQAAIAPAIMEIKQCLTRQYLTKEVPHSWHVIIEFDKNIIKVKSTKQEQCIKNHYRFEWQVLFIFDLESLQCKNIELLVIDLMFHRLCHDGKEKPKKLVIKKLLDKYACVETLDASEHRTWAYNQKRKGSIQGTGSNRPPASPRTVSLGSSPNKPGLLSAFLEEVSQAKSKLSGSNEEDDENESNSSGSDSDTPKAQKIKGHTRFADDEKLKVSSTKKRFVEKIISLKTPTQREEEEDDEYSKEKVGREGIEEKKREENKIELNVLDKKLEKTQIEEKLQNMKDQEEEILQREREELEEKKRIEDEIKKKQQEETRRIEKEQRERDELEEKKRIEDKRREDEKLQKQLEETRRIEKEQREFEELEEKKRIEDERKKR